MHHRARGGLGPAARSTSGESLVLWGEGANGLDPEEVTLRWQGFEWTPQAGRILRITPQNGQQLLDSLQAAGVRGGGSPSASP